MQGLTSEDYYNLYYGADRFTKKYLWKISFDEPEEMHIARFKESAYFNLCSRVVNTYMGFLFSPPPVVQPGTVDVFLWLKMQRAAFHALVGGTALGLALPDGISIFNCMQYQKNDEGIITAKHADGEVVIEKEKIIVTNVSTKKQKEYVREKDAVQLIRCNEGGTSLLVDVAPLNIRLYNLEASQDRHAVNSNFHVTSGPPTADDKIRPFQHFTVGADGKPFSFHTPDTSAMDRIETRIEKTRMAIAYVVGLESQLSERLTPPSGFSYQFQMFTPMSVTTSMALNLNFSFRKLCDSYRAQTGTDPGSITMAPKLNIDTATDKFNKARMLKDEVRDEEVIKACQLAMATDVLGEIAPEKLEAIKKSLETNGGSKIDRPGSHIDFQS